LKRKKNENQRTLKILLSFEVIMSTRVRECSARYFSNQTFWKVWNKFLLPARTFKACFVELFIFHTLFTSTVDLCWYLKESL